MHTTGKRAPRGQFDGVLQIARYNWSLYIVAVLVSTLVVFLVDVVHPPAALAGLLILGALAAGFLLPPFPAVSPYLFHPPYPFRLEWVRQRGAPHPPHLVDIHAGPDRT